MHGAPVVIHFWHCHTCWLLDICRNKSQKDLCLGTVRPVRCFVTPFMQLQSRYEVVVCICLLCISYMPNVFVDLVDFGLLAEHIVVDFIFLLCAT